MNTKAMNDEYYVHTIAIAYHAMFNQYCIYVYIDRRFCLIIELTYIIHLYTYGRLVHYCLVSYCMCVMLIYYNLLIMLLL